MVDIFQEVDEDLRREKLEKLWKKFGPYIIAGIVIVIGGMAGRVYWADYQTKGRIAQSDQYQAALAELARGNEDQALGDLERISTEGSHGYDLLAKLQTAALLTKEGKTSESLALYDGLSADGSYDRRYRDYAALMGGFLALNLGQFDEASARLWPLASAAGAWSFSARELLGLMAMRQGDWDRAGEIFRELSLDPTAPSELKARAGEYLRIVDVKKPQTESIETEPLAAGDETVAQEENADGGEQ